MSKEQPFTAPVHGPILETAAHREALARLTNGLGAREPFQLITGEPGTGKTSLVREAIERWSGKAEVAFVANAALTRTELLEEIGRRFGVEPAPNSSKPQLLASIEAVVEGAAGRGHVAVIVIDDAHDLAPELLEELRLLANTCGTAGRKLEIVLAGLPALEMRLSDPVFAPLRQRIGTHGQAKALTHKETRRYVQAVASAAGVDGAAQFPRETCRDLFDRSRGVTRAIHALAGEALRRARAESAAVVTPDHVRAAAAALWVGATTTSAPQSAAPEARAERAHAEPQPARPRERAQDGRHESREHAAPKAAPAPASAPARKAAHAANAEPGVAVPARAPKAPPAADTESAARAPSSGGDNDPRVREWVGRFIGDDEPRFGEYLMAGAERPSRAHLDAWLTEPQAPAADGGDGEAVDVTWSKRPTDAAATRGGRANPLRYGRGWLTPVAIGAVVLAAVGALFVAPQGKSFLGRLAHPAATEQAVATADAPEVAVEEAPAPVIPAATKSPKTTASAKTTARAKPATADPTATDAPASDDAIETPAQPSGPLALDVGTYLNVERAEAERDRLATETQLQAWVVEEMDGGIATYRVVLGIFSTPERARSSASMLLDRGSVSQAIAIPLPSRSRRR